MARRGDEGFGETVAAQKPAKAAAGRLLRMRYTSSDSSGLPDSASRIASCGRSFRWIGRQNCWYKHDIIAQLGNLKSSSTFGGKGLKREVDYVMRRFNYLRPG